MTCGSERKTSKIMKKRFFKVTAGIAMLAIAVFAATYAAFASYEIKILVNGEKIETTSAPFIEDGSTLIPLRDVFEALNASVSWNEEERFATAVYGDTNIEIHPDSGEFIKNGIKIDLAVNPKIVNDRIMVPLRAASESFGYNVLWNGKDYTVSISSNPLIKAHFLDCGQADSIFIELPENRCMLIDAGESSFGKTLEDYIKQKGYSHLDFAIATHPHSDHIGSMAYILDNFTVGTFYMPEKVHTTKTFERMLDSLEKNGCRCEYIFRGSVICDEEYTLNVLSPEKKDYIRMNDYSAVVRLSYNDISMLFSADAEANAEEDMVKSGVLEETDILKAGHHGSPTSSTKNYIDALNPKTVVISVGEGNMYGFPSPLVLKQFELIGAEVYRTDIHKTVTAVTDGYIYVMECE